MVATRRAVMGQMLALGATVPLFGTGAALAQGADDATLAMVHPDLRPLATQLLRFTRGAPPLTTATLAARRQQMQGYARPTLPHVPVEQRMIPSRMGQPDVSIYVVNAKPHGARPGILHTHGGGFVMGTAAIELADVQALAVTLDCAIVTVDYRLAPETRYAGSIEDNYTALKWLHDNAASLGADPQRLAVMGGSAGGGHAALLAITARDRGEVPLLFQCLTYPMLDDRTGSTRQMPDHVGRLIWDAQSNRFGWEAFLGQRPGGRSVPRGAVPARLDNLAGLPPAFIGVGTLDLFLDEDVDYAQRLNAARVPTELVVIPGAFHGFDVLPGNPPIAQRFIAARLDALRRGLGVSAL